VACSRNSPDPAGGPPQRLPGPPHWRRAQLGTSPAAPAGPSEAGAARRPVPTARWPLRVSATMCTGRHTDSCGINSQNRSRPPPGPEPVAVHPQGWQTCGWLIVDVLDECVIHGARSADRSERHARASRRWIPRSNIRPADPQAPEWLPASEARTARSAGPDSRPTDRPQPAHRDQCSPRLDRPPFTAFRKGRRVGRRERR
jgi:hypothetical protein